jgi:N-acetylneuraminic acid mutarotase
LNDLNLFDLSDFELTGVITCVKIDTSLKFPCTRWGHSAVVDGSNLYILGGRNDHDINDVHSFNLDSMQWSKLDIDAMTQPKARRRHACAIIGSSIIMFGGFDGDFFDDLNILPLDQVNKKLIKIDDSNLF